MSRPRRREDEPAPRRRVWLCPDCGLGIALDALDECRRLGGPAACGGEYLRRPIPAVHAPAWLASHPAGEGN
jgi:hypothetical protein